jgi:putative ABC transport system permease protein
MIADQKKYDQFHTEKERIFRIITREEKSAGPFNATTVMTLRETLLEQYEGIEKVVRFRMMFGGDVTYVDHTIPLAGFYADEDLFNIFDFELLSGDPETALKNPFSLVLTEEAAHKLFADEDPIGKVVKFNDRGLDHYGFGFDTKNVLLGNFTVTGVIKDNNYKTHIPLEIFGSWSTLPLLISQELDDTDLDDWKSYWSTYLFVLMQEGKTGNDLTLILNNISEIQFEDYENFKLNFKAQGLADITPGKLMNNPMSFRMPLEGFYFLSFLAIIVIISACFNYTNLSVARALTRAKEIGVRKINGARRVQIFSQFITEAIIISLFSLILSTVFLQLLKQGFTGLWLNKYLAISMNENAVVILLFIFFSVLIGFIAGFLPAWYLSSFQPLNVLKKELSSVSKKKGLLVFTKPGLGKSLVVTQFVFSLILIVTTILLFSQTNYLMNAEYGFEKENILNIKLQGNDPHLLANELISFSEIKQISVSSLIPATGFSDGSKLKTPDDSDSSSVFYIGADHNYIDNLKLELLYGSNLPIDDSENAGNYIIVNEAAAKEFGYESSQEIIGEVFWESKKDDMVEVIGVVKDFYYDLFMEDIGPLVIHYNPKEFRYLNVRISGNNLKETLAFIENKWKKIDKIHTYEYQFFDEQLANSHAIFGDLISIVGFISILAVSIACLGLLGMATYTAETRLKEIGIRKVMGASVQSLLVLLSRGFIILLSIAIVIGVPLAYFINNLWLELFAYKVSFGINIFGTSILVMLILGILTVGSQTLRAALINPIVTLRDE